MLGFVEAKEGGLDTWIRSALTSYLVITSLA